MSNTPRAEGIEEKFTPLVLESKRLTALAHRHEHGSLSDGS